MTSFDLDPTIRPQDDLFGHVNRRWLDATEIPADKPVTGAFMELRDASEVAIRDIVTGLTGSAPGTEAAQVENLFASFADTERIDALGLEPLEPLLAEIAAIASVDDLLSYFGRSLRRGTGAPVSLGVDADPGDPRRYALFIGQSGIGLPDEEYYRLEQHAKILAAYRDHIDRSLSLARLTASAAGIVLALETEIAARHWDKVRTRDLRAMYNPMSPDDLDATGTAWTTLLRAAGIGEIDSLIVTQPSYFADMGQLLTLSRLEDWKTWARWALVSNLSPYLPEPLVMERFDFYGTTLQGTPVIRERWKRGVDLVERCLGEAVGKLYVERHFSPVAKERMDDLVAHLIEAYHASISALDWMTEPTKAEALAKLARFTPKIGYPEVWRDYSTLVIDRRDLVGNVIRATEFFHDDEWSKLGGPIRKHEWLMTPQTVNAYYHPLRNEIVFPAAILQPPFFDESADEAVNYGAIGAVIGHEIGHGFDDQGSHLRRGRSAPRLVDGRGPAGVRGAHPVPEGPVRRARTRPTPRCPGERRADDRREHRGPGWSLHRLRGLAAGVRWARTGTGGRDPGGAAVLPQLGPRLAEQATRRGPASAGGDRSPRTRGVPLQPGRP